MYKDKEIIRKRNDLNRYIFSSCYKFMYITQSLKESIEDILWNDNKYYCFNNFSEKKRSLNFKKYRFMLTEMQKTLAQGFY